MRIETAHETYFAFPVTNETEVHHDKGSGAKWHVALDDRGGVVVSDGWKVYYGTYYGNELAARTGQRIGWDYTPPLYVQSVAYRLVTAND